MSDSSRVSQRTNIVRIVGRADDLQAKDQLINLDHFVTANAFPTNNGDPRLRIVTTESEVEFNGITLDELADFLDSTGLPTLRAKDAIVPAKRDELDELDD